MTSRSKRASRSEYWQGVIAEQERSGQSIRRFCQQRRIGEHSFYLWRKRLGQQEPVRFALVDTGSLRPAAPEPLELILATGERLRISAGADAATLRTVLEALRA